MNVRLAAQVLSKTVEKVLLVTGSAEVAASANLCFKMDKFFDCFNVRNTEEHKIKLKSFLRPYRSVNDVRFAWLDEFLQYSENWKTSTLEREINFSQRNREVMFLPWQTYERLRLYISNVFKRCCSLSFNKGIKTRVKREVLPR